MPSNEVSSTERDRILRTAVSSNVEEMDRIRRLIVTVIDHLRRIGTHHPRLKNKDLRAVYRDLAGVYPDCGMKPHSATTYHWLFGFGRNGRNYLRTISQSQAKNNNHKITLRQILLLSKTLERLELAPAINTDEIFVTDSYTKITAVIKYLEITKDLLSKILNEPKFERLKIVSAEALNVTKQVLQAHIPINFNDDCIQLHKPQASFSSDGHDYDPTWHFSKLLQWHAYTNGTRPNSRRDNGRQLWTIEELSAALHKDKLEVYSWFNGSEIPESSENLNNIFFGAEPSFNNFRIDLEFAISALRKLKPQQSTDSELLFRGRTFDSVPPRVINFTGREDYLQELEREFFGSKQGAKVVLHSFGGAGKTCLAIEYAHHFHQRYSGIWWCPSATRHQILSSLTQLAVLLGLATIDGEHPYVLRDLFRWLSTRSDRWLIIFDNASNSADLSEFVAFIKTDLLITSRFSDWASVGKPIRIDTMPIDSAADLLQKVSLNFDRNSAVKLADVLGGLPLALVHAATICRRTKLSFDSYIMRLETFLKEKPAATDYPQSIYAMFEIAFCDLAIGSTGNEVIWILSQCGSDPIPLCLVESCFDSAADVAAALLPLIDFSLVKLDVDINDSRWVSIHPILQTVVRFKAKELNIHLASKQKLLDGMSIFFPFTKEKYFGEERIVRECIGNHVRSLCLRDYSELKAIEFLPDFLLLVSRFLWTSGTPHAAEDIARVAIRILKERLEIANREFEFISRRWQEFDVRKRPDFDHVSSEINETFRLLQLLIMFDRILADVLEIKHKNVLLENIDLICEAITCCTFVEGPDSQNVLKLIIILSMYYIKYGLTDEAALAIIHARNIYNESADLRRLKVEEIHPDLFYILTNDHQSQVDVIKARIHQLELVCGAFSISLADLYRQLAVHCYLSENHTDALSAWKRDFKIRLRHSGIDDEETLFTLGKLGSSFIRTKRIKAGQKLMEIAIGKMGALLGKEHGKTLRMKAMLEYDLLDLDKHEPN